MASTSAHLLRHLWLLAALAVPLFGQVPPRVPSDDGARQYTVLLDAPATGQRLSSQRSGKLARRGPARVAKTSFIVMERAVGGTQEPVIEALRARGAVVLGSVRNVLNAVFVRADEKQAESFLRIPGVSRVVASREVALGLIGVEEAVRLMEARSQAAEVGATGEGISIAVIDSGLDFLHPAFSDDSLALLAGFPKGRPADIALANSKVVAIRTYQHLQNTRDPATSSPDDSSAWDFSGHGTAVAMIAAGGPVESPAGPVSGIAPKAYLGIYKVSGTPGLVPAASSQAVIAAIDDAVVDGMDILNLSLGHVADFPWNASGRGCGQPPDVLCDPLAAAAQSAVVDFGRVVVAAAGNDGRIAGGPRPARATVSTPAVAPEVIAVAATANPVRLHESVSIARRTLPALSGSGPGLDDSLRAPARLAASLGDAQACGSFEGAELDGAILVARRGGCWFADKAENAAAAGAAGLVVYDDQPMQDLVEMSALRDTDIPAYFVSAESGSVIEALVQEAGAEGEVLLAMDPTPLRSARPWRSPAAFSSRGPSPGLNLKPDIAAPGLDVYTAGAFQYERIGGFNPSEFRRVTGTSAAAPAVAGAAALVWQRHPALTSREVASALINTASVEIVEDGERARAAAVGAGLLDVAAALEPIAAVEPATVGFGMLSGRTLPVWQEIYVTNRAPVARSYELEVVPRDNDRRAAVTLEGRSRIVLGLEPDEYRAIRVSLEGLRPLPGSYEGHVAVRAVGELGELRVPYLYLVGDNVPHTAFATGPGSTRGFQGEVSRRRVSARFVDRFGVGVADAPAEVRLPGGEVTVLSASNRTDRHGVAEAVVEFGPSRGPHEAVIVAGGVELPFTFYSERKRPRIDGIYNSATLIHGRPLAPGSLATILGGEFSKFWGEAPGAPLPVALKAVSVSFDFPEAGISEPGRVFYVRPEEVGVQIPWELAGLNFAYVKVRFTDRFGDQSWSEPVVLELADISPELYSVPDGAGWTSAWHADGSPVTTGQPASAGDTILMQLTGTGPFAEALASGDAFEESVELANDVAVSIDGLPATVTLDGSFPGVTGLTFVEAIVPSGVRPGIADVVVSIGGIPTEPGTVPVR